MTTLYSDIRNDLKTGDLVLFSGRAKFSKLIRFATCSRWSHCGLIVKLPEYDFVTVWESTTLSNIEDLATNELTKGVQLVALSDRVAKYNGEIAIRKLEGDTLTSTALMKLMNLRAQLKGKKYERSKMELFKAAYDGPLGHNSEDLSSVFCSELVAEAYQALGLVSEVKSSNEYTPADFSFNNGLVLNGDFSLSDEIMIK